MSKSRRSSIASVPCRLEWRPSRWLGAMSWALALLAPFSTKLSEVRPPKGTSTACSATISPRSVTAMPCRPGASVSSTGVT